MAGETRLYEQFQPHERLTLMLEALARRDEPEAVRLRDSCPRKTYTQSDDAFEGRLQLAFDTVVVVCIDLRGLCGKLDALAWATAGAKQLGTWQQINATMAFLDGTFQGRGRRQMEFFQAPHPAVEDEEDDGDADEPGDAEEPAGRLSAAVEGELARRMAAVEDRSRHATDVVMLSLLKAQHDVARELADVWHAFGRFCRSRVGVEPEAMLAAWELPLGRHVAEALKQYPGVEPDLAKVDEYAGYICTNWDRRYGG